MYVCTHVYIYIYIVTIHIYSYIYSNGETQARSPHEREPVHRDARPLSRPEQQPLPLPRTTAAELPGGTRHPTTRVLASETPAEPGVPQPPETPTEPETRPAHFSHSQETSYLFI